MQFEQFIDYKRKKYQTHSRHIFIPFLDTLFPLYVHSHHGLSKIIHTPKLDTHPRYPLLISYVLAQTRPTMICIHQLIAYLLLFCMFEGRTVCYRQSWSQMQQNSSQFIPDTIDPQSLMNIIKQLYFSLAGLSSINLSSCDVTSCNDLQRQVLLQQKGQDRGQVTWFRSS